MFERVGREHAAHRSLHRRTQHFHSGGRDLPDQHVAVAVDHQPAQPVAFGVDDAVCVGPVGEPEDIQKVAAELGDSPKRRLLYVQMLRWLM